MKELHDHEINYDIHDFLQSFDHFIYHPHFLLQLRYNYFPVANLLKNRC